ncbi:hypothetical protein MSG28_007558 [Choristoneura fumiferana]|uniref:Uncharacterized protein n=1 Tax=Choristoneura fumiferana TaxID=7141 RepID=A0ACC0JXZ3_CHOFU|nr:hypothetical protein MSG28_007558 [Choristoneura fumiferana]
MTSIDFDPAIKLCLKHLHSSASDSTEQLRLTLDDIIRQTYGSAKTLGNVLPKKYLNEEKMESPRMAKHKSEKAASAKTVPIPQQSPQQLQIPERENDDGSVMDGELPFDLLEEDLTCAVCRQIAVQAGNRLVECDACHALYHQDCHKPVISDNDMSAGWQCASCLASQGFVTNYTKISSASKSPTHVSGSTTPVKISSGSSSSKVTTPNINIISADKRLQIMKKKAAKQHEKKKHNHAERRAGAGAEVRAMPQPRAHLQPARAQESLPVSHLPVPQVALKRQQAAEDKIALHLASVESGTALDALPPGRIYGMRVTGPCPSPGAEPDSAADDQTALHDKTVLASAGSSTSFEGSVSSSAEVESRWSAFRPVGPRPLLPALVMGRVCGSEWLVPLPALPALSGPLLLPFQHPHQPPVCTPDCRQFLSSRLCNDKKTIDDVTTIYGICTLQDCDLSFCHMRLARLVRDLDFARYEFYVRTGIYQRSQQLRIKSLQGDGKVRSFLVSRQHAIGERGDSTDALLRYLPGPDTRPQCPEYIECWMKSMQISILVALAYMFWDVNYFLRVAFTIGFGRLFQKKCGVNDTSTIYGFCTTQDVDIFLRHMNNARYVRELDFARFHFYDRTGIYANITAAKGHALQGASSIRYRRTIPIFSAYKVETRNLIDVNAETLFKGIPGAEQKPQCPEEITHWLQSIEISSAKLRKKD